MAGLYGGFGLKNAAQPQVKAATTQMEAPVLPDEASAPNAAAPDIKGEAYILPDGGRDFARVPGKKNEKKAKGKGTLAPKLPAPKGDDKDTQGEITGPLSPSGATGLLKQPDTNTSVNSNANWEPASPIPGIPLDEQSGTSYTIPVTDDVSWVTGSNAPLAMP
ncbi:MAG: hypothetical protein ABSG42_02565 [Nitrospirota bacterium]